MTEKSSIEQKTTKENMTEESNLDQNSIRNNQ